MTHRLYDLVDNQVVFYTYDTPQAYFEGMMAFNGGVSLSIQRFEEGPFLLSYVLLRYDGRFEIFEEVLGEERGIVRFDDKKDADQYFESKVQQLTQEWLEWEESTAFRIP